jgi:ParB-like chromosome segregation protein Spo0J
MSLRLQINAEYQHLVREISIEDYEAFKWDTKEKGLLFPIIVNNQGVILDGHYRYRAWP